MVLTVRSMPEKIIITSPFRTEKFRRCSLMLPEMFWEEEELTRAEEKVTSSSILLRLIQTITTECIWQAEKISGETIACNIFHFTEPLLRKGGIPFRRAGQCSPIQF